MFQSEKEEFHHEKCRNCNERKNNHNVFWRVKMLPLYNNQSRTTTLTTFFMQKAKKTLTLLKYKSYSFWHATNVCMFIISYFVSTLSNLYEWKTFILFDFEIKILFRVWTKEVKQTRKCMEDCIICVFANENTSLHYYFYFKYMGILATSFIHKVSVKCSLYWS